MKIRTIALAWLSLLLLTAGVATAEVIPFDLEVGWRFTDVEGNEDLYRTQVNEREGFLVRSFTLVTNDFNGKHSGALDHFRIDAADLGVGPWGSFRLEAGKTGAYNLRVGYRAMDAYSAHPWFANPRYSQGIVPGQHTYDRDRTMIDIDLELLPFRRITPFIGYSYGQFDGPGTTTYNLGQDEFLLRQDLDETDSELRAGFAFNAGRFYGQLTQGWRSVSSDETLTLFPGAGSGNNPGNIIGRPITADGITRSSTTDIDTPFTNADVTGQFGSRVRLSASYVTLSAENEGEELENASGSFASFGISRFFGGLTEGVASAAENDTWRGSLRADVTIVDGVEFEAGYRTEQRELRGAALISSLFTDTITFSGADPRDIEEVLQAESALERDEDVLSAAIVARALGPVSLRAEVRQTTQDVTIMPDLSEIVVPGGQGGTFERQIDTLDLSGNYRAAGLLLSAAYRVDSADDIVLRTDYLDRDRLRLRASWQTPAEMFRAGVTAEMTQQENDQDGIGYDGESDNLSADFELGPWKNVRVRGSYSTFDAESTVNVRSPQSFAIITSFHQEDGDAIEGGVNFALGRFGLDAALARFENEGTIPFAFDRQRVRLSFDLFAKTGLAAEYASDDYDEENPFAQYEATRYGLFLRWRP